VAEVHLAWLSGGNSGSKSSCLPQHLIYLDDQLLLTVGSMKIRRICLCGFRWSRITTFYQLDGLWRSSRNLPCYARKKPTKTYRFICSYVTLSTVSFVLLKKLFICKCQLTKKKDYLSWYLDIQYVRFFLDLEKVVPRVMGRSNPDDHAYAFEAENNGKQFCQSDPCKVVIDVFSGRKK